MKKNTLTRWPICWPPDRLRGAWRIERQRSRLPSAQGALFVLQLAPGGFAAPESAQ
jgi:hypothetical protein